MGTHKIHADLDVDGEVQGTSLDINGNADISGNLTLSGTYPRILLTDSNSDDDYSIINDNGTFIVYNDTDSSTAFAIAGNNNATFSGTIITPSTVYVGTSLAHYGDGDTNVTFDTNDLKLKAGGATHFHAASDQTTLLYSGNTTALTLDTSQNATFTGNVLIPSNLQHVNDDNNEISFGTDTQDFRTNNSSRLDISNSGVRLGGGNARVTTVLDEDNMATDSATALATQQSIKAYVDSSVSSAGGGDVTLSGAQTFTGVKTFGTTTKLQFRDSAAYINSPAANDIEVAATTITLDASSDIQLEGNTTVTGSITADQINLQDGGDYITFYGNDAGQHSISSRDNSGTAGADDLRINSYGAVHINLDSNDNNGSGADFTIGRHGSNDSAIANLFTVSGETGYVSLTGIALDGNTITGINDSGEFDDDDSHIMTSAGVLDKIQSEISNLVDSSPSALNTLNELAAAINDDASFSTTITNSIATKLPLAGGTMSGNLAMGNNNISGVGNLSLNAGALSITGDGSNAATLTESGAGILTIATVDALVLDSADDITLDAAGNDVIFKDSGTHIGTINMSNSDLSILSSVNDKDIIFKGKDGGSDITALTLDMSAGGKAIFEGNGQFNTNLKINAPDGGSSPAMTAVLDMHGYEGRGVGIKMRDSVNSASSPSDREWFVGTGYGQSGFNIGYASDGSQSSYAAQNKFSITTGGAATFAGTLGSGAFTSTGKITGTELEGTSLDINGNADISGQLFMGQASAYSPTGGGSTRATITHGQSGRTDVVISNQTNHADAGSALVLATHGHDFIIEGQSSAGGSNITFHKAGTLMATIGSSQATFAGEVEAASLDINGNGDVSGTLTVHGNLTANGNIIGDDNTSITNISSIGADSYTADADSTTTINMGATSMDFLVADSDVFNLTENSLNVSAILDITGTTDATNATGDTGILRCEGGASIAKKLYVGSTITGSADVIAFSDRKLKENIETLDGKKVLDMRGVSFTRKDTGAESSGVIAQEIQKVAPELVHDTEGTLGVAYGNLVGYLIEAIKDQQKQIDELKELCNGCSK